MSYLGSKAASGAYQAIIAQMPPHDVYIELFLGTGVVMRMKQPAVIDIGVEIDDITLSDVTMIDRTESDVTIRSCASTLDRSIYRDPQPDPAQSEITILASTDVNDYVTGGIDNPGKIAIRGDAFEFLDEFDFEGPHRRILIYADPPYLLSTRSSRHRYRHDFTESDHHRLLRILKTLVAMHPGVMVIISGYPSCFYDAALENWRSIEFQVMTRGGVRTEKLWMSFCAGAVHWHDYAGSGFTDRQRIKRKADRWAENYKKLPHGERNAILAAMLEAGNDCGHNETHELSHTKLQPSSHI